MFSWDRLVRRIRQGNVSSILTMSGQLCPATLHGRLASEQLISLSRDHDYILTTDQAPDLSQTYFDH